MIKTTTWKTIPSAAPFQLKNLVAERGLRAKACSRRDMGVEMITVDGSKRRIPWLLPAQDRYGRSIP